MAEEGHEQVVFFSARRAGLKAIVAFHDTTLGPALGGTRMFPYETEESAVNDALRLAKGMTYKSGAAGMNFGGGKGIIWGDPAKDKTEVLFRAYGRFIEGLGGRLLTGTDVGTFPEDFVHCAAETKYMTGLPKEYGGTGDTSVLTAYGVFLGIQTCAQEVFGTRELAGRTVAVQGVGKVGSKLCGHLKEAGASLIISDLREDVAKELAGNIGAVYVPPAEILFQEADILSPNALGGALNSNTIPLIKCKIVAGAANNQLGEPEDARRLFERGILYAPDYIINAGGVIQVGDEVGGYLEARCKKKVEGIPGLLETVFRISKEQNIDTEKAAKQMVDDRIRRLQELKGIMVPDKE